MDTYLTGALSAVWLGFLTAISPCPLATNIAALSYLGKQCDTPRRAFASGLLYTAGRSLAYVGLSLIIVASLLSVPEIARALQKYMNIALGPILLFIGLILIGLIRFPSFGLRNQRLSTTLAGRSDLWASTFLGALFALSFCPVSAALFFGSLIPLATRQEAPITYSILYGLGTALPVLATVAVLVLGFNSIGRWYLHLSTIERYARPVTGAVFIIVGIYFVLTYLVGVNL